MRPSATHFLGRRLIWVRADQRPTHFCIAALNGDPRVEADSAIAQTYVSIYFPADAKRRMWRIPRRDAKKFDYDSADANTPVRQRGSKWEYSVFS
jgi:hypothetical protein